jgi:hypothetical protein
MCPWGSSLLLGNANGGIRRLQIGSDDPVEHRPKLVEVSGQQLCMLAPGRHAGTSFATVVVTVSRQQIGSNDPVEHRPKLVEVSGQQLRMLAPGQHAGTCFAAVDVAVSRQQIGSDDPVEHRPKLVEVSGQQLRMLAPGQHAGGTCDSSRCCWVVSAVMHAGARLACWHM